MRLQEKKGKIPSLKQRVMRSSLETSVKASVGLKK